MIENWIRENIKNMKGYSPARQEYSGRASVYLDANENPFGSPVGESLNRYPDPLQIKLKKKISTLKGIPVENIFLGNGSDEAIDLLLRITCEPGVHNMITCPPTYGMYQVCAAMNDIPLKKVPLTGNFQLDTAGILKAVDGFTRLLFICSPNNPTGNSIPRADIEILLNDFNGLVVIDEAYIDYGRQDSCINKIIDHPNLVVLQTLSKAWGLAGLRLGMAFANGDIIHYLNKIKYPYNINTATQELVLRALENQHSVQQWTNTVVTQRQWLSEQLASFPFVKNVYKSDANFLLVRMEDAEKIYHFLLEKDIVVRNRSAEPGCENCLRITVGTPGENDRLVKELKNYSL